jgi:hypothetical protein
MPRTTPAARPALTAAAITAQGGRAPAPPPYAGAPGQATQAGHAGQEGHGGSTGHGGGAGH